MKRITKILCLNILMLFLLSNEIKAQLACGTQITEEQQNYLNRASNNKRADINLDVFSKSITTIPIVPHIIQTHFGQGGLSEEDLNTSIAQLNESFAPLNFKFESCGTKYIKHNAYYNEMKHSILKSSNEFKMTDSDYVEGAINIYFVPNPINSDGNSFCGWAYLPGINRDWLVIKNDCATNGSTLAHEMGHYFRLYHTHNGTTDLSKNEFVDGSNCLDAGDKICDTPAEPYINEKEKKGLDKCIDENCIYICKDKDFNGDLFKPNTNNLMSYSLKECRKTFSPKQIERMQTSYLQDRKYLANECTNLELNTCKAKSTKALLALYNATDGANWTIKWDLDKPIETWHGVHLNDAGCVESLWMYKNNLNGHIPPEIGNLEYLEYLRIIGNKKLVGIIPNEIGNLRQLKQLNLAQNNLEGGIPIELSHLKKLEYFDLQINNLTGSIPREIGRLKELESLILQKNNFAGNLPTELTNLSNLKHISINNNNLSGCYEPILESLCNQIIPNSYFISRANNFDATWENFCNNGAGACVCDRNSDSLVLVTFYNSTDGLNWKTKWDLKKSMDTWFGVSLNDYGCVKTLAFDNNSLKGMIPPEIGNLAYLENFTIYNDRGIVGNIPPELGNLKNLRILKLALNRLEGSIPPEIGNLYRLEKLDFQTNRHIEGNIPLELGNLKRLETLKLSYNRLTGGIPTELNKLSNLDFFALHHNKLEGCYNPNLKQICNYSGSIFYYLISKGNNFDATWEDFCNNDAGTCNNSKFQRGDFNNDGIVNNVDAIYLGLAYGDTGSACAEEDIVNCLDWETEVNGVNGKFQDGDGNGIINAADLNILEGNYGVVTTSKLPKAVTQDFSFKLNQVFKSPDQLIFELYVEDSKSQHIETHGLACSLNFGTLSVKDVKVEFENSALSPTITVAKFNEVNNTLDIALSRSDKKNVICNGYIAKLIIGIIDLEVDDDYIVQLLKPNAITATGTLSNGVNNAFDSATAENRLGNTSGVYLSQNKPNPFFGESTIQYFIPASAKDTHLKIYNLTGHLLQTHEIDHTGTGNLNLSSDTLEAGLYIYTLEINGEPKASKRMIIH